ncbi:MAG: NAD(P)-dependent oxidoreductase [Leptolyngbya foveolarum]|uniref:NAD(P)-dependent oxidoreductase n=1 Tax=Leptolyngbya foveolarum TaxID=47253 RepID=A0A2W4TV00_9CYAN|nr:MAG: NAD(P)-dependent oxidoreductase [Leptolyngbya foveolarum]
MKTVIIGCGYVGKTVAHLWKAKGFDVLATTTSPERIDELSEVAQQVAVLKGTEAEKLLAAIADREVALLCVGSKRGANYRETYLSTAQTIAKVLPQTAVKQLIYTSTCSIYGQNTGAWINETMPPNPSTENGKIVEATEQTLLAAASPQLKVCILRLGGIYGPGRTVENIYSRIAGKTMPGKGEEAANWVHLLDIIGAIDWAQTRQLSGIYNVVQDEIPTRAELMGEVCDRLNLPPVKWDGDENAGRGRNVRLSNQKLKSTGYQFEHPAFWT